VRCEDFNHAGEGGDCEGELLVEWAGGGGPSGGFRLAKSGANSSSWASWPHVNMVSVGRYGGREDRESDGWGRGPTSGGKGGCIQ